MPKVQKAKRCKVIRQGWNEANMCEAIKNVQEKKMGWKLAARTFNVPATTLRRRVNKNIGHKKGDLGGCRPVLGSDVEKELVAHITNKETQFLGLSTTDVRALAYQIAKRNDIPNKFNNEREMAGWAWLHSFLHRNPEIILRVPENTSAARAQAFNKVNIMAYFKLLENCLIAYNFSPENIYNMDESGYSTVQTKPDKIYATKGRKQVGVLSSAERGQHYTVVCAINAVGSFIPPAFIFPRKNMKPELMDNSPAGSICFCQDSGYMTAELMIKWLDHFIRFAKPSPENKVLLLLDGHASHKNFNVLQKAKENGIILFIFPAHCTHRCQPLDVGFFGPLQVYYNQQIRLWLNSHPGRVVTHLQVAQIFNEAYLKAAMPGTAIKAFKVTGIHPFNANIFEDWMFAPAEITNKPLSKIPVENNGTVPSAEEHGPLSSNALSVKSMNQSNSNKNTEEQKLIASPKRTSKLSVSIEEITALPTTSDVPVSMRKPRKKGKFGIVNSTPEIEVIKAAENEKLEKQRAKLARAAKKKLKLLKNHLTKRICQCAIKKMMTKT